MLVSVIFVASLISSVVAYRMKATNLSKNQAYFFYLKCKCCKTKKKLEGYD